MSLTDALSFAEGTERLWFDRQAQLADLEAEVAELTSVLQIEAWREQRAAAAILALRASETVQAARQPVAAVQRTQRRAQRPSEARRPPPQPKAQPIVLSTRRGAIHHGAVMPAEWG